MPTCIWIDKCSIPGSRQCTEGRSFRAHSWTRPDWNWGAWHGKVPSRTYYEPYAFDFCWWWWILHSVFNSTGILLKQRALTFILISFDGNRVVCSMTHLFTLLTWGLISPILNFWSSFLQVPQRTCSNTWNDTSYDPRSRCVTFQKSLVHGAFGVTWVIIKAKRKTKYQLAAWSRRASDFRTLAVRIPVCRDSATVLSFHEVMVKLKMSYTLSAFFLTC